MNWIKAQVELLPETTMPENVDTVEIDKIYPFIGEKKTGSTRNAVNLFVFA